MWNIEYIAAQQLIKISETCYVWMRRRFLTLVVDFSHLKALPLPRLAQEG